MVSREYRRAAMYKKLQRLRSITNSNAHRKTSIILDASNYIEKLKQKVEQLDQDVAAAQNSADPNPLPVVRVQAQEKGFLIDVLSERSCPGLLVFILEAFEELGLAVLQARVSCSDSFHLEAVGNIENQGQADQDIDNRVVKQAVFQAIQNWSEISGQQ